jgi:U5 small nuclear ribonucleoprotein component
MDDSLYDEFGNYLGPDLDEEEEEEELMEEEEEVDDYGLGEQYVEEEVDQEDQQDSGMQLMHVDGRGSTGYL